MSKFNLPGVGSNWERIGNSPPPSTDVAQYVPPPGLTEASQSLIVPAAVAQRLRLPVPAGRYYLEFVFAGLGICSLVQELNFALAPLFELGRVAFYFAIFFSPRRHIYRWITRRRCRALQATAEPGWTACAVLYGVPDRVFDEAWLYWDIGLIQHGTGANFVGRKHSFALPAAIIERSQGVRLPVLGEVEYFAIDWKTRNNQSSSVYFWDPATNKAIKPNATEVIAEANAPFPIDCSNFPTAPEVAGWSMYPPAIAVLLLYAYLLLHLQPEHPWLQAVLYLASAAIGFFLGKRWQRMFTHHQAAKHAIVESTE
ncbi:MAG TPA: hypothetical protein VK171_12375 [Fimbriimonas sp.]|nr:hypothetical protein [Fimbriimonas sp.]